MIILETMQATAVIIQVSVVVAVHICILLVVNMELTSSKKNYQLREPKTCKDVEYPLKLESSVRRLSERKGFINYDIEKRYVSTAGGNYLSLLCEIDVKGRTNEGPKELHLFVKSKIDEVPLNIFSISDLFATEMVAYKELANIFERLQEQANIPLEERYKMVKMYEESNQEALIMENIAKNGFTLFNRMEVASLNFYEESVKYIARFHGLSFVLRETNPDYFKEVIKPFKTPFNFKDGWTKLVTDLRNACINHVDDKFKDRLDKAYDDLLYRYSQYYTDDNLKVCICHGDYRPCNILIKIDKGEIQELIPIDYQLTHYGCPVFDFLYLIFIGTDRPFRKANLLNLKNLYYETLAEFLKYFSLDVNAVYPRVEFEKVYKEKLNFGLMSAVLIVPFVFASENDVPDFCKSEMRFNIDVRIKERLHDLLKDFTEWGFL